jgi:uncharacterized protein (TIGR02996 family)
MSRIVTASCLQSKTAAHLVFSCMVEAMNEREALLRAVCENPDDDTPRLVFADWLQEYGDEARAEFIRLQIQLARGTFRWSEKVRLDRRERELIRLHRPRWARDIPGAEHVQFIRGFAEYVRFASGDDFIRAIGVAPSRYVVIRGPADLIAVMGLPHLERLECLDLEYATLRQADVAAFVESEWPVHPKRLVLPRASAPEALRGRLRVNDWVRL